MWWTILSILLIYIGIISLWYLLFLAIFRGLKSSYTSYSSFFPAFINYYRYAHRSFIFNIIRTCILIPFVPFYCIAILGSRIEDKLELIDPRLSEQKKEKEKEKESEPRKFSDSDLKRINRIGLKYRDD